MAWGRSISRHWDVDGGGRAERPVCRAGSTACSSGEASARSHAQDERARLGEIADQMMRQWAEADLAGRSAPDEPCEVVGASACGARAIAVCEVVAAGADAVPDACGQSPSKRARSALATPANQVADDCMVVLGLSPEADVRPLPPGHCGAELCIVEAFLE